MPEDDAEDAVGDATSTIASVFISNEMYDLRGVDCSFVSEICLGYYSLTIPSSSHSQKFLPIIYNQI